MCRKIRNPNVNPGARNHRFPKEGINNRPVNVKKANYVLWKPGCLRHGAITDAFAGAADCA